MIAIAELRNFIAKKKAQRVVLGNPEAGEWEFVLNMLDDLAAHIEKLEATAPSDPLGSIEQVEKRESGS